jgi:hypothetical protein
MATKTEIYATVYPVVEEAMRSCGLPTRGMWTGIDVQHIARRVADAVYRELTISKPQSKEAADESARPAHQ